MRELNLKRFTLPMQCLAVVLALMLAAGMAAGDELYHQNGKIIRGNITEENDTSVKIKTDNYGELNFEKASLLKIVYSSGRPPLILREPQTSGDAQIAPLTAPAGEQPRVEPTEPVAAPYGDLFSLLSLAQQIGEEDQAGVAFNQQGSPSSQIPGAPTGATSAFPPPLQTPAALGHLPPLPTGTPSSTGIPGAVEGLPPLPAVQTDEAIMTPVPLTFETPESTPPPEMTPVPQNDQEVASAKPTQATPGAVSPLPPLTPSEPPVTPVSSAQPPAIQPGYDGALFGVLEDVKVMLRAGEWAPAVEGTQLKVGNEVKTGKGKVKMILRGRGELRLPQYSHIALVSASPDGSEVTVELKGGRVWNNITPGGGTANYHVKTPDLVAGVRGGMPGLFSVSVDPQGRTRVANFFGDIQAVALQASSQAAINVAANTSIATDPTGRLTPPETLTPEERREWEEWDQWALEVHEQIASRFVFGGQQISNLAQLAAQDAQRHEAIVSEANRQILFNREEDQLNLIKDALIKFHTDTGRPVSEEEGLKVLIADPGAKGWKGPYLENSSVLKDKRGRDIVYYLRKSPYSGNVYGEIVNVGLDGINSKGAPGTDDMKVLVPYYRLNP
ncbi:MAG: type II secretion system protein GspG [bacterium]